MFIFYALAALALIQSVISLRGGFGYLSHVRRECASKPQPYAPRASVVVPCRGLDQGLRENFNALFSQDYPEYEIIFVSDDEADPALALAGDVRENFRREGREVSALFVAAGDASDSGQKVHNLRAAVQRIDAASEVLVFVDTDARPSKGWLRNIVAPLADEGVGAATGYRWFIPSRGGLASHMRAVWNASIASALGADGGRNFCWGGSTAIRRATFERLDVRERWRGTLSDDFALTRMLQEARLPIRFAPACLTPSIEDCAFKEMLEFTTRQMKITRVYAPHLWRVVLFSNLLFTFAFFGGAALVIYRALAGLTFAPPLALLLTIYALGTAKAVIRLKAVSIPLYGRRAKIRAGAWAHILLWPAASALYLYNALAAAVSRRIRWRGLSYELKSPTETEIIR